MFPFERENPAKLAVDYIWQDGGGMMRQWALDRSCKYKTGGKTAVALATNGTDGHVAIKLFAETSAFIREAQVYEVLVRGHFLVLQPLPVLQPVLRCTLFCVARHGTACCTAAVPTGHLWDIRDASVTCSV